MNCTIQRYKRQEKDVQREEEEQQQLHATAMHSFSRTE